MLDRRHSLELMNNERSRDLRFLDEFAVAVQSEFEKIGENQVGESMEVSLQLIGGLGLVEKINGRSFGFDVPYNALASIPDSEVWISCLSLLGQDRKSVV